MSLPLKLFSINIAMIAAVWPGIIGATSAVAAGSAGVSSPQMTLTGFDTPFTFTYLSWQDKVQVAGGHAILKQLPCNGGAGVNTKLDLSACSNCTPVFRIKTTAANTARTIQLQLLDSNQMSGSWQFSLPAPSEDFVTITPTASAPISKPNRLHRDQQPVTGTLDLAHITQFQVQGDWQKGVVDLELDSILLVEPDAKMLAERDVYARQQSDEAAADATKAAGEKDRLARERQQRIWSYSHLTERSPEVTHMSLAAPDILALTIEAQRTIPVTMSKYQPQPGDEKKLEKWKDGVVRQAILTRNSKRIGRLQGRNLDWLFTDERLDGDPLLEFAADDPNNYTIQSDGDPSYAAGVKPLAAYRKSVPRDIVLPGGQHPTRHQVYLKLPSKFQAGRTYSIKVNVLNVKNRENLTFKTDDLPRVRSESVHVNQIGFRPDDPAKRAFLSLWLGTGGACSFPDGLRFFVLDDTTSKEVFTGKVEQVLAANGKEELWIKPPKNYSSTAVYRMDFSAFQTPGIYRIYVAGVGCSYPFEISNTVWEKAFLTQMKGLFNQRSGIELGPPFTNFKKPRDFHPDDGAVVTRSTYDVLTKGPSGYSDMVKGDTGEAVKDAWGGYHDAGDWNPRRVTHMLTTLAQLELCEVYPHYFNSLKLNIPPIEGVPDMITEALFEIDCFRRLQRTDGAVPHGIETDGDPLAGEVSWLSTQHCYVLAPNIRDTWLYAAVAGRAATVLKPIKPDLSDLYLQSATRAFKWAEAELARKRAAGDKIEKKNYWESLDARNLSSLILYDVTGEKSYHEIFLQDTCLKQPGSEIAAWGWNIQCDPAFLYARMDAAKTDARIREHARAGIISLAERSLRHAASNAFNITQREKGRPMFAGFFSTSGGSELVRAYYLTGKTGYLKGAVQSCQFQSGCNPNNIVYTTGLGANPIKVPLELDARCSGQPMPAGLTVFGNSDYFNFPNSFWDINLRFVNKPQFIWPDAYSWPLTEAYFDVWVLVSANEFVIDTWAPNVLVWGYLAARPDLSPSRAD